jgi:protoheme ferro-lyase
VLWRSTKGGPFEWLDPDTAKQLESEVEGRVI